MKKEKESGRSMVEMLGVLAIIGVLSVGGIAGYTTAMNKHRANQILNGASVRAIVVSTQIQRGSETPTLGEFTDNEVGGARFGTGVQNANGTADWTTTDKRFSLTLTGVDEKICDQMKATVGQNSIIREINEGCTTITYNNDLSTTTSMTDHKDSTSCESAGGVWDEATKTCGCPGRYTGSNCEVAPTSCPSGTTTTESGKCQYCHKYDESQCIECTVEQEGICVDEGCYCYNSKTQNAECNYLYCAVCDKSGEKPDAICPSGIGNCYCYNKETQNVKCYSPFCIICDKDGATPTPYVDGSVKFCYNPETQNMAHNGSNYAVCDKNGEKPNAICSDYDKCYCYNQETQNVKCTPITCSICDKKSSEPDVMCSVHGDCVCYNATTQNAACDEWPCVVCEKSSATPIAYCNGDTNTCSCVAE